MQISLVILAAGLGSRFKSGEKQTAQVGPNGEMILEYSIYDAIEAGFSKIIFVIRKEMEISFKKMIRTLYKDSINVEYVFQEKDDIPVEINYNRVKPWGTAHALYCLRNTITEPFAVINADDYYGKDAFIKMYSFLKNECSNNKYAMIGYPLENTLSKNGSVNRGICKIKNSKLESICEVLNISLEDGVLKNENNLLITNTDICSMGFYGFYSNIFDDLENMLIKFLIDSKETSEFGIPSFLQEKINQGCSIRVINSKDKWVGITYSVDLENVKQYFLELHMNNVYPNKL